MKRILTVIALTLAASTLAMGQTNSKDTQKLQVEINTTNRFRAGDQPSIPDSVRRGLPRSRFVSSRNLPDWRRGGRGLICRTGAGPGRR